MTISVCVPATRVGGLAAAIRSVRNQSWTDWELVVLGQGPPGAQEALEAATREASGGDPRVRYVALTTRGLSRARNAALDVVSGDVLAFLDDDCEADPSWLQVIAKAFGDDPTLGLVGGSVVPEGKVGPLSSCPALQPAEAVYDPRANPQLPPPGWDWIGANFAIRISAAERVGLWDAELGAGSTFPAAEDTDYKLRMEALGIRMLSTPRSVVVHSSGTRAARDALRSQRNYQLGNGALAAKQTLGGDPRGERWRRETWRAATAGAVTRRPHRLPVVLRRVFWFERGYRECRGHFTAEPEGLRRRGAVAVSWRTSLAEALRVRRAATRNVDAPLTLPVSGGRGGLLNTLAYRRLTSLLDPDAVATDRRSLRSWLERRQARRSVRLLVPDRATGMRFAGQWRLDLARIRVADLQRPPSGLHAQPSSGTERHRRGPRPWHAI